MRNRLAYFFRLRKQSDAVKMICIFGLAGLACFANATYHTWKIYCTVNTPVEYVLMGEGNISQKRMDEMRRNKSVTRASRQMERSVTVMYGGREATVTCTLLSAKYLEDMFDADISAGTRKIWMNRAAFSEWKEQLGEEDWEMVEMEGNEGDGVTEFHARYSGEEESPSRGEDVPAKYKSATIVVVESGGEDEEGAAYMAEEDSRLQKEATGLRVQFAKHDLDGLQVKALRKLGYEIQNEAGMVKEEWELKTELLHIKYGLLSCVLCAAAGFGLKTWAKRDCYGRLRRL